MLDGAAGVLADGEGQEALMGVPVARDTPCITSGRMCTCNGAYVGDAQKWLLSVAQLLVDKHQGSIRYHCKQLRVKSFCSQMQNISQLYIAE